MSLGVVDLSQVGIVAHRLDAFLQRDDLIIAVHYGDSAKLKEPMLSCDG